MVCRAPAGYKSAVLPASSGMAPQALTTSVPPTGGRAVPAPLSIDTGSPLQPAHVCSDLRHIVPRRSRYGRHVGAAEMVPAYALRDGELERFVAMMARPVDWMHQWRTGLTASGTRAVTDRTVLVEQGFTGRELRRHVESQERRMVDLRLRACGCQHQCSQGRAAHRARRPWRFCVPARFGVLCRLGVLARCCVLGRGVRWGSCQPHGSPLTGPRPIVRFCRHASVDLRPQAPALRRSPRRAGPLRGCTGRTTAAAPPPRS
jgi:hypothetical protein